MISEKQVSRYRAEYFTRGLFSGALKQLRVSIIPLESAVDTARRLWRTRARKSKTGGLPPTGWRRRGSRRRWRRFAARAGGGTPTRSRRVQRCSAGLPPPSVNAHVHPGFTPIVTGIAFHPEVGPRRRPRDRTAAARRTSTSRLSPVLPSLSVVVYSRFGRGWPLRRSPRCIVLAD